MTLSGGRASALGGSDVAVARGDYFEGSPREIMERIRAKVGNPA